MARFEERVKNLHEVGGSLRRIFWSTFLIATFTAASLMVLQLVSP
jgi:hypothetical protein